MKKVLATLMICSSALCFVACGNNNAENKDSVDSSKEANKEKFDSTNIEGDTKFAVALADGGMMEIESSKLALEKATAANVKDFAKMMVNDHTGAAAELKDVAAKKNISLPSQLSDDKQKKYSDLSAKKGADFDKAYIDLMVSEHEDAVKALQNEADKGNDADLRAWAAGKLPVIQHHLEVIKSIKDAKK